MRMNLHVGILALLPLALFAAKTAVPHLPIGGLSQTFGGRIFL